MPHWVSNALFWFFGNLFWDFVLAAVIATVIAWLRKKREQWAAPALYGLVAFVAVFVLAFTLVGRSLISNRGPETTLENVESNIKKWGDTLGLSVQTQSDSNMYFVLGITLESGHKIQVARPKDNGKYLQYQARLAPGPEERIILDSLPVERKKEVIHEVNLELARSKTGYFLLGTPESPVREVILTKMILITENLTEDSFLSNLNDLDLAIAFTSEAIFAVVERSHSITPHPALWRSNVCTQGWVSRLV